MNALSKLLVCAAFSLAAGVGFSQPAPAAPHRAQQAMHALGLTEEQRKLVTGILEKARSAAKKVRADLGVVEAQIRQAMAAPQPDLTAANALVDQKAALMADLEKQKLAEEVELRQAVGDAAFDQIRNLLARGGKPERPMKNPRP